MNKENILISLVIPVYNVEKYVQKCLESVCSQITEQVEVIVIDDGSTDNSRDICIKYIENMNKNVRIITQENSGLSATRNRGIEESRGKYIMFLDSDDEISSETITTLIENVNEFPEVDIFYYDAAVLDEMADGKKRKSYNRKRIIQGKKQYSSIEYFGEYYVGELIASACLCLIRKEVLIKNNIRFDKGKLYEDNVFSFRTLLKSQKVCYLPYDLYLRRYREDSITTKKIAHKNIEDMCYIIWRYLDYKEDILEIDSIAVSNSYIYLLYRTYIRGLNMMKGENWDLECMGLAKDKLIKEMSDWREDKKSITYYMFIYLITKTEGHDLVRTNILHDNLRYSFEKYFAGVCTCDSDRLAIYGRGKHTQIFLEEYEKVTGSPLVFDVYADTYVEKEDTDNDGRKIVNIKDIEKYADVLIISSFQYRMEMIKKCKDLNLNIKVIDLYSTEKMNLFDEILFSKVQ